MPRPRSLAVLGVRYGLEVQGIRAPLVTATVVDGVPRGDGSPDMLVNNSVGIVPLAIHPDIPVSATGGGAGVVVAPVGVDLYTELDTFVEGPRGLPSDLLRVAVASPSAVVRFAVTLRSMRLCASRN